MKPVVQMLQNSDSVVAPATVLVDASQFPRRVESDLRASLRARQVNHKFHYDSVKQAQKWLRVHAAYSPVRRTEAGAQLYADAAAALVRRWQTGPVEVVGLGCGGGQKDVAVVEAFLAAGCSVGYLPVDVSLSLTLVARERALQRLRRDLVRPVVCDLGTCEDLSGLLAPLRPPGAARCYTYFGMVPNFEPNQCFRGLGALMMPDDRLLVSANLAPGDDYAAGVNRVLPQYDNPLTRDWLLTWLGDLGVDTANDGSVRFVIEADPSGPRLRRITAYFDFHRPRTIWVGDEELRFGVGESLRLFFSYRYTPDLLREQFQPAGLQVEGDWLLPSGEEGVFLCRRSSLLN